MTIKEIKEQYPYLYETHCHTSQSSACAKCSGKELAEAAKEAGYTGIIITDHNWGGNTAIARNLVLSLTDYFGIPFIEPSPTKVGTVQTDGSNLNLRNYPSVYGTIIGQIPNGATVFITGQSGNWYVVQYMGQSGYASSDFITVNQ